MIHHLFTLEPVRAAVIELPQSGALSNNANEAAGQFVNRIAELLIALAFPLAVASILYSVYTLLVSQGDPKAYEKVKKILIFMTLGIFLIVFAVVMVRTVYQLFTT